MKNVQIVNCLNCGHEQEINTENTFKDDLGEFTECEECEGSFNID